MIVGAGMAGLVAAWELARAGHDPIVLEARGRVGGRVHTLREPFTDGLYAEVGAMRIPRTHDLTLAYCERFGLKLTPFTMSNPQAYVHLGGRQWRLGEVQADAGCLPFTLADGGVRAHGRCALGARRSPGSWTGSRARGMPPGPRS